MKLYIHTQHGMLFKNNKCCRNCFENFLCLWLGCHYWPPSVAYWPPTWPSCQKKKCTCVNNRCIRSKIKKKRTLFKKKKKWVGIEQWYNPGWDRKSGSWREDAGMRTVPAEAGPPGPRLSSPGEQERNAVMARRVGVNMLQFCSVSNSPLTR